jgi:predicted amidohydrolase YtcJ
LTTLQASITVNKPDELVARLKAYAAAHPEDPVIFGRADFSAAPHRPQQGPFDRAVSDRLVVIHNSSEHSLWVNSAALQLAVSRTIQWRTPGGARHHSRCQRSSNGTLIEAGMEVMERAVDAVALGIEARMLEVATRYLNSYGITSVVNATGNLARSACTPRCASAGS